MTRIVGRLDGGDTTLLLTAEFDELPAIAYCGPALPTELGGAIAAVTERALPFGLLDEPEPVSLLPEAAVGFMGAPGIACHRAGVAVLTRFRCECRQPAPGRLVVEAVDSVSALAVDCELTMDESTGVISASSRLRNAGDGPLTVDWLCACAFPLPDRYGELLTIGGRWGSEFRAERRSLGRGLVVLESRCGRSSHHAFPGAVAGTGGFSDGAGEVTGLHLGWSGNHRLFAERLRDGRLQVQAGELFMPGETILAAGETYRTPTLFAVFSNQGLNGMRARLHDFVRRRVLPRRSRAAPVCFNTWDAVRFAQEEGAMKELIAAAAGIGAERFVIDDGWFRGRDDDRGGLGDWLPSPRKFPSGLAALADAVRGAGMQFGLWVEPEAVSADSALYREHPDWVLGDSRREQPLGRNQYVLDVTREPVSEYLLKTLTRLVDELGVACFKWDMNRDLTHAVSNGRPAAGRQIRAVYALMDRLRRRYPALEIEACSSGGARADFAMLSRTERIWISDCHDPLERRHILYGASLFFPPEVLGNHVGPERCPVTGRAHDIGIRTLAALIGNLGVECDIRGLREAELDELAGMARRYRSMRRWMPSARLHWLSSPDTGLSACSLTSPDGERSVVSVIATATSAAATPSPLRLTGLVPSRQYRVRRDGPDPRAWARRQPAMSNGGRHEASGAVLMAIGLPMPVLRPGTGILYEIESDSFTEGAS